ncbi:hypothetical protein [Solitalea koreensis]|nr:hypothetical protein [Solitalea koreensis]
MIWIIIVALVILILCGLLFLPLELEIDSRVPVIAMRWIGIGKVMMIYEKEEWQLDLRIVFFHHNWALEKLIFAERKPKKRTVRIRKKKRTKNDLSFLLRLFKSFRIAKWQLAIDSGDYIKNAWLYPLNYAPYTRRHLYINFMDGNYLVVIVRNSAWRILYAWIK